MSSMYLDLRGLGLTNYIMGSSHIVDSLSSLNIIPILLCSQPARYSKVDSGTMGSTNLGFNGLGLKWGQKNNFENMETRGGLL